MKHDVLIGQTDYSVLVFIPDSASTDGSGKTGLVAANLTVSFTRVETDNDIVITDATGSLNDLAALTTAHTDWGLKEVSSSLAPGLYRLDISDAVFTPGAWSAVVYVMVTTSAAAASPMEFTLIGIDKQAAQWPANVTQFGGSAGTFASGRPEVNSSHIAGSAVSASSAQIGVNVVNAGGTAWGSGAITSGALATSAVDEIVDGVWNEPTADHVTDGTTGEVLNNLPDDGALTSLGGTPEEIADAVWEEAIADHEGTVGSTAEALADAGGSGASAADIADAVWDEATSGHTTSGTFGEQAKTDVDAILAKTAQITFTSANKVDATIQAAGDFAQGAADKVWSTAARTLTSFGTLAADVWAVATRVLTAGTNIVLAKGAGVTGFNDLDAAGVRSAVGLASANLDTQLSAIDDFLDTEIAAIKAVTDQFTAAQSEPVAVPAANASPLAKIAWLAVLARNKVTQDATTQTLRNDADSGDIATATVSDNGTTFTRGEWT